MFLGAYGTVYKVQRQQDGKFFALKKMTFSASKNKPFADAYKAEMQALVRLTSFNDVAAKSMPSCQYLQSC